MLDKFLQVAYRSDVEKTASRQLVDKLKDFPLEELKKLASGDENCKLAFAMEACGPGGSADTSWIGKYKGTPLFAKAVELEKQLLQIDMEEQQTRAAQPPMNDAWQKRDAIRLQQRMLDLDLAMAENGGDPTAGAEPSPEELSTADAPELALEQEGPPAEPKAPKGPAAAEAGPSPEEEQAAALEMAAEEEAAGGGGPPAQEGPPQQQAAPPKPKPKAPPKEEEEPEEKEDGPKIEVKQSSAAKIAAIIGAGRFLAKTAKPNAEGKVRAEVAKKFPNLSKEAEANPEGHHLRRALLGNPISSAIEAKPGSRIDAFGEANGHLGAQSLKGLLKGGLGGAALGGAGGLALGLLNKGQPMKAMQYGAGIGGGLGAIGGDLYGAIKGTHGAEASRIHGARSKHAPLDEKTAGLIGSALNAGKAALPAIGGALNAGKNLATTAHAAGGLPQVASSFGNVAKNFAMKNPLAAAGVAGAGGMVAGKMLTNSQPRQ